MPAGSLAAALLDVCWPSLALFSIVIPLCRLPCWCCAGAGGRASGTGAGSLVLAAWSGALELVAWRWRLLAGSRIQAGVAVAAAGLCCTYGMHGMLSFWDAWGTAHGAHGPSGSGV